MPDDSKRPLKVFLCHAHPDAEKVRALYARLKADGVDAWLDKENIIPGQDWEFEIRKAVRESDIVVVCLSKQFSQKGYRQNEVRIALEEASLQPEGEIFIIPARLEECNYLESLKRFHGVDLFEERGYEYLMRALRLRADKIGAVLQAKKGWLGGLTLPTKKPETQKPKSVVKPQPTLKAEEITKQPAVKELTNDELAEKIKAEYKSTEKIFLAEIEKENKQAKRELWRTRLVSKFRYWLKVARISALPNVLFLIGVVFAIYMFVSYSKDIPILNRLLNPVSQPSQTSTEVSTPTITFAPPPPTLTITPVLPTKTKVETLTPTATSQPTELTDEKGVEMVFVPAGEFTMGVDTKIACQDETSLWFDCEKTYNENSPLRSISLEAYYIDKYEVTNAQYSECVSAKQCKAPSQLKVGNLDYYGNKEYNSYPVVWVGDAMAKQYCLWRGARLPISSEWEKAARGPDQRIYPWGNETDVDVRANGAGSKDGFPYIAPVGSFPLGVSPYGAFDMAGNVAELVNTNDIEYYSYFFETYIHPMVKGGNWNAGSLITYEYSGLWSVEGGDGFTGFRCARDANP